MLVQCWASVAHGGSTLVVMPNAGHDGEMIEMTLYSRHRIQNSSPGGLRPSTLPHGHGGSPQY